MTTLVLCNVEIILVYILGGALGLALLYASGVVHVRAPTVLCLIGLIPGFGVALMLAVLSTSLGDHKTALLTGAFAAPLCLLPFFYKMSLRDPRLIRAARGLGSGRWRIFRSLTVPFYRNAGLLTLSLFCGVYVICRIF